MYGSHFRRVTLDAASVRGGLLGQGSILTVTSYRDRTSPVFRGKWILENMLGSPPPPPPPNVPALAENAAGGKVLSMRERMAQHRTNPVCASCHDLMDPIGLSHSRTSTRSVAGGRTATTARPIDASGQLPDGTTFKESPGLRQAVLARPEAFVRTVTEKLLTYGAGPRAWSTTIMPAVRGIVRDGRAQHE